MDFYTPADIQGAHERWGANCGPCALAAILQTPIDHVQEYFREFATRHYVNPTHMQVALRLAGQAYRLVKDFPDYGLCFVQWEGPWTQPGVPVHVAYRYTHWIGAAYDDEWGDMVYDCNSAGGEGEWTPRSWWETEIVPVITASIKRANGQYSIRTALEVGDRK